MQSLSLLALTIITWVERFGGPGLILLALADNSFIPLPGSLDAATIILTAHKRNLWIYYGLMAAVGAIIGGYLTYRVSEKGGEEAFEKKIGKERAQKVYKKFEKHGWSTIVIGSLLPPPFPIVPVLSAPAVLKYPRHKFLSALAVGRTLRFMIDAYIGRRYGQALLGFLGQYKAPVMYALIALAVLGGIAALVYVKYYRPKRRREERERGEPVEDLPIPGKGNQKLKERSEKSETEAEVRFKSPSEKQPDRRTA